MKGFTLEDLHTYPTPEPFFEYIHPEIEKGEILIIENKDTWYTLRKIMREEDKPRPLKKWLKISQTRTKEREECKLC